MLGEGVDTSPSCNDERVEEFLAAAGSLQPHLPHEQQDGEDDTVSNEGASHDEMRQTLTCVISPAESKGGDSAKEELYPGHNRECLAQYTMPYQDHLSYLAVYALFKVELQVDAHDDLGDQNEHNDRDKFGVNVVLGELAALMSMTQEVTDDGKDGARDLYGNVPSGADYLAMSALSEHLVFDKEPYTQDHSCGEDDPPCEPL